MKEEQQMKYWETDSSENDSYFYEEAFYEHEERSRMVAVVTDLLWTLHTLALETGDDTSDWGVCNIVAAEVRSAAAVSCLESLPEAIQFSAGQGDEEMGTVDHHSLEVAIHAFLCGSVFCFLLKDDPVVDLERGCWHLEALGEAWRRWWMGAEVHGDDWGDYPLSAPMRASNWTHLLAEAMKRWGARIARDFCEVPLTADAGEGPMNALIAALGAVERMLACAASCIHGRHVPGTRAATKALAEMEYDPVRYMEWRSVGIEADSLQLTCALLDTVNAAVIRAEACEPQLRTILGSKEMRKALETAGRGVVRVAGQREPQLGEMLVYTKPPMVANTYVVNDFCSCMNKLAAVFFLINERSGRGDPDGAAACVLTQLTAVGAAQPAENERNRDWRAITTRAAEIVLQQPELAVVGAEDKEALESLCGSEWEENDALMSTFNELMEAASDEDWRRNPERLVARAHVLFTRPTCSYLHCSEVSWAYNSKPSHICSGCRCARYCSKDHSRADWKQHRRACRELQRRRAVA